LRSLENSKKLNVQKWYYFSVFKMTRAHIYKRDNFWKRPENGHDTRYDTIQNFSLRYDNHKRFIVSHQLCVLHTGLRCPKLVFSMKFNFFNYGDLIPLKYDIKMYLGDLHTSVFHSFVFLAINWSKNGQKLVIFVNFEVQNRLLWTSKLTNFWPFLDQFWAKNVKLWKTLAWRSPKYI